jgi:hypothetical protein
MRLRRSSQADIKLPEDLKIKEKGIKTPKNITSINSESRTDLEDDGGFDELLRSEKRSSLNLSVHIKRNTAVDRVMERKCETCNSLQPPYVYHCSLCKRCVVYMDHHCPWVNNCVGYYSQKYFVLFCAYGSITFGYASIIMTLLYNSTIFGPNCVKSVTELTGLIAICLTMSWMGFMFIIVVFCD